jgi:hypothetical protein
MVGKYKPLVIDGNSSALNHYRSTHEERPARSTVERGCSLQPALDRLSWSSNFLTWRYRSRLCVRARWVRNRRSGRRCVGFRSRSHRQLCRIPDWKWPTPLSQKLSTWSLKASDCRLSYDAGTRSLVGDRVGSSPHTKQFSYMVFGLSVFGLSVPS